MSAFRPKGETPEWRMIYERVLSSVDFGQIIMFAELDEALGRRFVDDRSPIYRAREDLGTIRQRWLEPVRGVGYRVTEPSDHVRVSVSHRRKSQRQVQMATRVLGATNLGKLTSDELAKWDNEQKIAFAVLGVISHEQRIRNIEDLLRKEGML